MDRHGPADAVRRQGVRGTFDVLAARIEPTKIWQMVKNILKAGLRTFAKSVPWGAREALLQGLCERSGNERALAYLARSLGYTAFMADGEYGLIQGCCEDQIILPVYARTKTWARTTVQFLTDFFSSRGGTYVDIGANIGLTTLPIAKNENVHCIAFEPEPTNFRHLRENVRRNTRYPNVELHQLAVMDKTGSVSFVVNDTGNPGDHRVVADSPQTATLRVQAVSLDDVFGDLKGPLAVKIDTQGAEPFVIAGGARTLSNAEAIVMEYSPYLISKLKGHRQLVIDFISKFSQVAILAGETEHQLQFTDASTAMRQLQLLFDDAWANPRRYWDVYAHQ